MSGGVLYDRIREQRGLNYGDYAYIEYFPRGMFQFEPSPNLARRSQIFQIWIRPVEPPNAKFALRLALYELDKLVKEGIPAGDFERTRGFLVKYANLLTRTKSAELGYAVDSLFYGIPNYNQYLKTGLARLTRDDVNRAIQRYLDRPNGRAIVAVSSDAEGLKRQLSSGRTIAHEVQFAQARRHHGRRQDRGKMDPGSARRKHQGGPARPGVSVARKKQTLRAADSQRRGSLYSDYGLA